MHNGQVGDWSLIRRRVEALIPDDLYKCRIGTTDSEAVFLSILGAGGVVGTLMTNFALERRLAEPGRAFALIEVGRDRHETVWR